ncbi:MAG: PilW family protein [Myxococcota bacterium]
MRRARRGMTLIEVTISVGILVVVVAMTMSVVIEGVRSSRRGQQLADANDAARFAGEALVHAVQAAGFGMANGLYVSHGGVVVRTSPLVVINSTTGPDELWVVRTHRAALLEACVDDGAATTVQASGFGKMLVRCAVRDGAGGAPTLLLATNMSSGALLSNPTFNASGAGQELDYTEAGVANFGPDPNRGFQKGDLVMPALVERYFIGVDNGAPALMVQPGTVGSVAQGFAPTGGPRVLQRFVEDLQLAVGLDATVSGEPDNVTFSSASVGPAWTARLRSVRVSVVARSPQTVLDAAGSQQAADLRPMTVEDHAPGLPVDGFRRTLFSRRVELSNVGAVDL